MPTVLGKIKKATFGIHKDLPEHFFGLELEFSLDGGESGVSTSGQYLFNILEDLKENQDAKGMEECRRLVIILLEANVRSVEELAGIPVEVTLDGNAFDSFRILKEVL